MKMLDKKEMCVNNSKIQKPDEFLNGAKRQSIIDRGKLWAKQFIKLNKTTTTPTNGFASTNKMIVNESSYDSGIESNGSSKASSISSKISTSSTCSFSTSPCSSASNVNTKSSTNENYDQVYSSTSNSSSSKSSSSYLLSPIDESGYLVPIVNFTNTNEHFLGHFDQKSSKIFLPNSHLTRSFSTRSAYQSTSASNNLKNLNKNQNRATICENNIDYCIKCNCKLNLNDKARVKKVEEESSKVDEAFKLFESFTCSHCLESELKSKKVNNSIQFEHNQTKRPTNPPPPLPSQPPPSLAKYNISNQTESSKTLLSEQLVASNSNAITITPFFICSPQQSNKIVLKEAKLLNNICNCNFCFLNACYLNPELIFSDSSNASILTNRLSNICNQNVNKLNESKRNLNETTENCSNNNNNNNTKVNLNKDSRTQNSRASRSDLDKQFKTDEPIIYIDDTETFNYSLNNQNSSAQSEVEMNHLLSIFKQSNSKAQAAKADNRDKENSNKHCAYCSNNKCSDKGKPNEQTNSFLKLNIVKLLGNNQLPLRLANLNELASVDNSLSTSKSVESFEFINAKQKPEGSSGKSQSYEKSWENSSNILMEKMHELNFNQAQVPTSTINFLQMTPPSMPPPPIPSQAPLTRTTNHDQENNSQKENETSHLTNNKHLLRNSIALINQNKPNRISFPFVNLNQLINVSNFPLQYQQQQQQQPTDPLAQLSSIKRESRLSSIIQPDLNNSTNGNTSVDMERLIVSNDSELLNRSAYNSSLNSYSFSNSDSDLSIELENLTELWYQPNMPRDAVQNFLLNQEIGSFIIRLSNSCKDCFALSIRVPYFANPNGIAHYLINKSNSGYKLKGVDKEFKSLKSLITHYSVMQEILPVTLNLHFANGKGISNNNNSNVVNKNICYLIK